MMHGRKNIKSETCVNQYMPYTMPVVCLSDWVTPSSPWSQWKFVCEWCRSPGLTEDLLFMVMTFPWLPVVSESNTQVGRVKIKLWEWQHNSGFHAYGVWMVRTRVSMVARILWLQQSLFVSDVRRRNWVAALKVEYFVMKWRRKWIDVYVMWSCHMSGPGLMCTLCKLSYVRARPDVYIMWSCHMSGPGLMCTLCRAVICQGQAWCVPYVELSYVRARPDVYVM